LEEHVASIFRGEEETKQKTSMKQAACDLAKMEAALFSETSVDFQRTTWRYISQRTELFITTAVRTSNPTFQYYFPSALRPSKFSLSFRFSDRD
jgi:hypothetical protein